MRTLVISTLLVACAIAPPATAAAWGGSPPPPPNAGGFLSQQQGMQNLMKRDASWRQRLMDRMRELWNKRPFQSQPSLQAKPRPLLLQKPTTPPPGTLSRPPGTALSTSSGQTTTSGTSRRSIWAVDGGFGRLVSRAIRGFRVTWEHRTAAPGSLNGRLVAQLRAPKQRGDRIRVHSEGIDRRGHVDGFDQRAYRQSTEHRAHLKGIEKSIELRAQGQGPEHRSHGDSVLRRSHRDNVRLVWKFRRSGDQAQKKARAGEALRGPHVRHVPRFQLVNSTAQ